MNPKTNKLKIRLNVIINHSNISYYSFYSDVVIFVYNFLIFEVVKNTIQVKEVFYFLKKGDDNYGTN